MAPRKHNDTEFLIPGMYPFVNFNWQQQPNIIQPDVTQGQEHHVSGLLFHPDLVADNQPTYANDAGDTQEDFSSQQPCYMNTKV